MRDTFHNYATETKYATIEQHSYAVNGIEHATAIQNNEWSNDSDSDYVPGASECDEYYSYSDNSSASSYACASEDYDCFNEGDFSE